ncbi:hypothetical protein [Pseudomonas sp. H2_D10]
MLDLAIVVMEETYCRILNGLAVIGHSCTQRKNKRLEAFIRDIHFQPAADDDYYKRVLR